MKRGLLWTNVCNLVLSCRGLNAHYNTLVVREKVVKSEKAGNELLLAFQCVIKGLGLFVH